MICLGYSQNLVVQLVQEYDIPSSVALRLTKAYGGRARDVLEIAKQENLNEIGHGFDLLVRDFPILRAEVTFAIRHDWACHVEDILARRTRLLFLNKEVALRALPIVVDIMQRELNWDDNRKNEELQRGMTYAEHFGGPMPL